MRILVTGGAGFIGSHLVEALIRHGHKVRVADNLSTGSMNNLADVRHHIEFIETDLADAYWAMRVTEGIDAISHHAAVPSVPRSVADPLEAHQACATTTINMLNAAREHKVKRFIYAASSSAYGNNPALPKSEEMPAEPRSPYAAAKLAGEHYVEAFAACYGLSAVSLRYFNIFGPRQDPGSPYSGVIARFIRVMSDGERPTIFGDGTQTRDFTYVDNAVHANVLALESEAELRGCVLNVGVGERISLNQLAAELNRLLGTRLKPSYEAARAGDVLHSAASLEQARKVLGYVPRVDFATGLERTLAAERAAMATR